MARRVSNKRNSIYLSVIILGFVFCLASYFAKYFSYDLNSTARLWMYLVLGVFAPLICWVCIFYPQIEIYTGKTYTTYSHVILGFEITLGVFVIITMFCANPTFNF